MPAEITICLTIPDRTLLPLIRYGCEEASLRLGIPLRLVDGEPHEGMIIYGPVPDGWNGGALDYDRRCYEPAQLFAATGFPPLWAPKGVEEPRVDLIGGLCRLLTLADETQIADGARDARGIFKTAALPEPRAAVRAEPLVEHHVAALRGRLKALLLTDLQDPLPLWPSPYRYAVLITHDTDAVSLAAPMEIFYNGAKAMLRRDLVSARMAWHGLSRKGPDPHFCFMSWADDERRAGMRSTFFLYGRGKVAPTIHDCRSSVFNARTNWDDFRRLADEGWEFGLHPPIRAKNSIDEFLWGKDELEARLRRPVRGLRHHYWALDWRNPHLTFRKHVNAGFRYDASISWRDEAGFRAGSCLPYRPYDPGRRRALDMFQLPTAISDGQLPLAEVTQAVDEALRLAERVRRVGGMLVLDWHTESAVDDYCYRDRRPVLVRVLDRLQQDSDAWFTTPWELVRHWHGRRRALLGQEQLP